MALEIDPSRLNAANESYRDPAIIINGDGTITRNSSIFQNTVATSDPDDQTLQVLSKDVPVNQSNNTWVRIFLPRQALDSSPKLNKLPLIVYIHGGGFVIYSPATNIYQELCSNIASEVQAVIVSVGYRLAPEHRLPAAYDDAVEALHWIKTAQEEWLQKYADFSCCFIMGDSAGGNIAYRATLLAASQVDHLLPLKIRGLIMIHPFFGGVKRTESELRLLNDPDLPGHITDLMWELSLPPGVDRDHEYSNPTVGGGSKLLDQIGLLGWKVMVTGGFGDPLVDRQIELLKIMEQKGVKIVSHFDDSGHRMKDFSDPAKRKAVLGYIKDFVVFICGGCK